MKGVTATSTSSCHDQSCSLFLKKALQPLVLGRHGVDECTLSNIKKFTQSENQTSCFLLASPMTFCLQLPQASK